ncbi:MAG TPA: metal-dependent hydrolase [Acidimicrobiales bacterium]
MGSSSAAAVTARPVPVRRIRFAYDTDAGGKHFMDGDLVMSHVIAILSSTFPSGEDFFVRSVRNLRDEIDDPELRRQVGGFIGQEAIHGREHRVLNERLADLGYPTRGIDRLVGWSLRVRERISTKRACLALTAALEHYTATMAYVLLTNADARDMITDPEIRNLLLWHALEESEHKSVAFDVYKAVGGGERLRTITMTLTTVFGAVALVVSTAISLARDRAAWNLPRLARSVARLRRSPWLRRDVRRHVLDYNRADFHPDDHDIADVVAAWRQELFGSEGTLVDRLPTPA